MNPDSLNIASEAAAGSVGQLAATDSLSLEPSGPEPAAILIVESRPAWTRGLEPAERPASTAAHSGVTTAFIVIFALIALTANHLPHIFTSIKTDMFGVRRRNNAFDSHTSGEARTLALMILMAATCEAVIIGRFINPMFATSLPLFGATAGLMVAYYLFQLAAYSVVGYTFTDPQSAAQWCRGFNLSQGLLGFLLLPPALVLLFYPPLNIVAYIYAAVVYLAIRVSFIYKGFRIFYDSFGCLVYFILYLCTLELIPPIAVYSGAIALNGLL
ncbi:MAG: DUF4271 domain-containing protein [Muribaculaceae bacterium]|nr:DUF4271 domain-containing protein [Muribaculaceae bacterium]